MDGIEVIVWIFFILATIVFNLVQQWKRRADRRAEALRERVEDKLDAAREAQETLRERAREAAAQIRHTAAERARTEARARSAPAPLTADGWGRAHDEPLPEELLEAAPLPLPPATPQHVPAPTPLAQTIERDRERERRTPPPVRVRHHRPFRTPQEVRKGIIAMTVLGPCRAMDPYDMGSPEGTR
ncbi:hypothetical protein [Ramlibacter rhizophilus]|uniref:Uncharacterized protein n=1 Tax=Ramlibacter rhizophilus TaxID=1781167 RepID=A0A4Z0BK05_9BURK|nr:hypothetical protein [Ramlibacter rhizophilus]TFY98587.1 hypothetical protein EZ242_13720 [Ramlibacter rhizophilus]